MNSEQKFYEDFEERDSKGLLPKSRPLNNLVSIKAAQEKHAENFAAWLDSLEPITLRTCNFKTLYCHYKGLLIKGLL